jgi:formate dehydrogenase iron-sulfur subunit
MTTGATLKPKAMIQDNTRCIGCRACMVACKSWNERPADQTEFFAGDGYQNPRDLDANNYTLITFNEITTGARPNWVFGRQLCMHCDHPACASACPTTALTKTALGPVVFNESRCIGCRACMQACPFLIPKYDYDNLNPKIHKCTFCADRLEAGLKPACATVCPTGAISFGDRDDMVAEAKRRIATAPGTYIPEIYGLDEVGGTSVLHLSSVPFAQIGYLTGLPKTPMPDLTHRWLRVTPHVFGLLYAVFGALTWIMHRRHSKEKHEKGATA